MTPKGQMTRGSNSGPAVMMMPPHIRATFMPNPPLKHIPPIRNRRKTKISGVVDYLKLFENRSPAERIVNPTPKSLKDAKSKRIAEESQDILAPLIEEYRKVQRDCGGEYQGMNCYNTLFIGRLAYEVTERKLLREMESFGPVKDIKLIFDKEGKSRGYGFVEYENEEDLKRAYRAADGMRIEGREIVVDVERGHTVPTWLPRKLGGGLGGTRLGGKTKNVKTPGRFDPSRPEANRPIPPPMSDGPSGGMGRGQGPPIYGGSYDGGRGGGQYGGYRDGPPGHYGGPPASYAGYGGPARGRGGGSEGGRRRRRSRSRSPDRRYAPRPRY